MVIAASTAETQDSEWIMDGSGRTSVDSSIFIVCAEYP